MADFAIVVTAAEAALGWSSGSFLDAYDGNRAAAHELTLEQSPVAQAVRVLADEGDFEGRATELLQKLEAHADESSRNGRNWPRTPHHLSGQLRRLAPNLRAVGIEVTFPDRKAKERNITVIRNREGRENSVTSVISVTNGSTKPFEDDADDAAMTLDDAASVTPELLNHAGRDADDADDADSHTHSEMPEPLTDEEYRKLGTLPVDKLVELLRDDGSPAVGRPNQDDYGPDYDEAIDE